MRTEPKNARGSGTHADGDVVDVLLQPAAGCAARQSQRKALHAGQAGARGGAREAEPLQDGQDERAPHCRIHDILRVGSDAVKRQTKPA